MVVEAGVDDVQTRAVIHRHWNVLVLVLHLRIQQVAGDGDLRTFGGKHLVVLEVGVSIVDKRLGRRLWLNGRHLHQVS